MTTLPSLDDHHLGDLQQIGGEDQEELPTTGVWLPLSRSTSGWIQTEIMDSGFEGEGSQTNGFRVVT